MQMKVVALLPAVYQLNCLAHPPSGKGLGFSAMGVTSRADDCKLSRYTASLSMVGFVLEAISALFCFCTLESNMHYEKGFELGGELRCGVDPGVDHADTSELRSSNVPRPDVALLGLCPL